MNLLKRLWCRLFGHKLETFKYWWALPSTAANFEKLHYQYKCKRCGKVL